MCEKCDADRGFLPLTRDQTRHRRNPEQRRQVLLSKRVACFLNGVQDSSKDSRQAKKAGQYGKSRIPSRAGGVSNPSQQRIPA